MNRPRLIAISALAAALGGSALARVSKPEDPKEAEPAPAPAPAIAEEPAPETRQQRRARERRQAKQNRFPAYIYIKARR